VKKEILCVICPSSCHITVCGERDRVDEVLGFSCKRGKEYATTEFIAPKRVLTTTVAAKDYVSPVIPVRTNRPVPKESLLDCMKVLNSLVVEEPFQMGRVVMENILDSGADVILSNC
jgi:CxxC motif-containing protein